MRTRIIQSGDAQALLVPQALQFESLSEAYEIERQGACLIVRPVGLPLGHAQERFQAFTEDMMAEGRPEQGTQARDVC